MFPAAALALPQTSDEPNEAIVQTLDTPSDVQAPESDGASGQSDSESSADSVEGAAAVADPSDGSASMGAQGADASSAPKAAFALDDDELTGALIDTDGDYTLYAPNTDAGKEFVDKQIDDPDSMKKEAEELNSESVMLRGATRDAWTPNYPEPEVTYPSSEGNTVIESISVKWLTGSDASHLSMNPRDNSNLLVRMELEYSISGDNKYGFDPGEIEIKIPAYVFTDRNGNPYGEMHLSVPEEPEDRGLYNYRLIEEDGQQYYILTNTQYLEPTHKGMFEFSIHGMYPSELVDMSKHGNFWGVISAVTQTDNTIQLGSNQIDATINTHEELLSVRKSGQVFEDWQSNWPRILRPENYKDYIYVRWTTTADKYEGNQPYTMTVVDTAQGDDEYGEIILGRESDRSMGISDGVTYERDVRGVGYTSDYGGTSDIIYTAYPKENFEAGKEYTLTNTATWTLYPADGIDAPTTRSASSQVIWSPRVFKYPTGHFMVYKWSGKPDAWGYIQRAKDKSYGYTLNKLMLGQDVDMDFTLESIGYGYPWTYYDPEHPEMGTGDNWEQAGDGTVPINPESYGKIPYTMETFDEHTYFDFLETEGVDDLTSDDFKIVSLDIRAPSMYTYAADADGNWDYRYNSNSFDKPPLEVYGMIDGSGEWVHYATVTWEFGCNIQCDNGATASGNNLIFPEDVRITDFKTVVSTKQAAIRYFVCPTIRLFANEKTKAIAEKYYEQTDTPSTKFRNDDRMLAYDNHSAVLDSDYAMDPEVSENNEVDMDKFDFDAGDARRIVELVDYSRATLNGAAMGVQPEKEVEFKSNTPSGTGDVDWANRIINLHYTCKVNESTNVESAYEYREAAKAGVFLPETSCTWYDLLPEGVQPVISSVRLGYSDDPNDTRYGEIQDVYLVHNYKNSGRTLLVVKATHVPSMNRSDELLLKFDAMYSFDDYIDLGGTLHNVVAFESGNDTTLGTISGRQGEPDDPRGGKNIYSSRAFANNAERDVMTDLDPDSDECRFVYAGVYTSITIDKMAITGYSKLVSIDGSGFYSNGEEDEATSWLGGGYTYRLRIVPSNSAIKNIVMYDSLENYTPISEDKDYGEAQWRGTFSSIDVSQLEAKGIAPVVYYSTVDKLDVYGDEAARDLTNGDIWSTELPDDLSTVHAIAIDCRKAQNGSDFTLPPDTGISAFIHMVAPSDEEDYLLWRQGNDYKEGISDDVTNPRVNAHAYNDTVLTAQNVTETGGESDNQVIHNTYTKVGLIPYTIYLEKKWDDRNDYFGFRPQELTVHLYGDGVDTGRTLTLNEGNNWSGAFENIPMQDAATGQRILYTFVEDGADKYTSSVSISSQDGSGVRNVYTLTNTYEPETVMLEGEKTWVGDDGADDVRPESIKITVYADGSAKTICNVVPNEDGSWSYKLGPFDKYKKNYKGEVVEINYTVTEEAIPKYVTEQDGYSFTNRYYPYGDLQISKSVYNSVADASDTDFEFTINLIGEDGSPLLDDYEYVTSDGREGTVMSGSTITLKGGETATIKNLPSESTYAVTEAKVVGYTQSASNSRGSIVAGETAYASFTNTYNTKGNVQLKASKELTGRALLRNQFRFDLRDANGRTLATAFNNTDGATATADDGTVTSSGSVTFGQIQYFTKDANKTFTYTIVEVVTDPVTGYTYDGHTETVTVDVVDNGDGTMTCTPTYDEDGALFENEYHAESDYIPLAWKALKNGDLEAGQFTFELLDEEGNVLSQVTNDAEGNIAFEPVKFTEKNVGRPVILTIREVAGENDDIVYDDSVFYVRVTASDNGDGSLLFDQEYVKPAEDGEGWVEADLPVFENQMKPGKLSVVKRTTNTDPTNPNQVFKFKVKLTGEGIEDSQIEYELSEAPEPENAPVPNPDSEAAGGDEADQSPDAEPNADYVPSYNAAPSVTYDSSEPVMLRGAANVASAPTLRASAPVSGVTVSAETPQLPAEGATVVKSGVFGEDDSLAWEYYSDGTLVWKPAEEGGTGTTGDMNMGSGYLPPWSDPEFPDDFVDSSTMTGFKIEPGVTINGNLSSLFEYRSYSTDNRMYAFKTVDMHEVTLAPGASLNSMFNLGQVEFVDMSGVEFPSDVNVYNMFYSNKNLAFVNLSGATLAPRASLRYMFSYCGSDTPLDADMRNMTIGDEASITSIFRISGARNIDMSGTTTGDNVSFYDFVAYSGSTIESLNMSNMKIGKNNNLNQAFGTWSGWATTENGAILDLSNTTIGEGSNLNQMAYGIQVPLNVNLTNLTIGNGCNCYGMFQSCTGLTSVDVSTMTMGTEDNPASTAIDARYLFGNCTNLTEVTLGDGSNHFGIGSNVDLSYAFYTCPQLTSADWNGMTAGDNVKLDYAYQRCTQLQSIDMTDVTVGDNVSMKGMFDTTMTANGEDNHVTVSNLTAGDNLNMENFLSNTPYAGDVTFSNVKTGDGLIMTHALYNSPNVNTVTIENFETGNDANLKEFISNPNGPNLSALIIDGFTAGDNLNMEYLARPVFSSSADGKLTIKDLEAGDNANMSEAFRNMYNVKSFEISGLTLGDNANMYAAFQYAPSASSSTVEDITVGANSNMQYIFSNEHGMTTFTVDRLTAGDGSDLRYFVLNSGGMNHFVANDWHLGSGVNLGSFDSQGNSGQFDATFTNMQMDGSLTDMSSAFSGNSNWYFKVLDLTGFNTTEATYMYDAFRNCSNLWQVTLDENWRFHGSSMSNTPALLPTPSDTTHYTGNWVRIDDPTMSYSPAELADAYDADPARFAGTWVWEPKGYYELLFFRNDDVPQGDPPKQDIVPRMVTRLNGNPFYKFGYNFLGWNTAEDGSGISYEDRQQVVDVPVEIGLVPDVNAEIQAWPSIITVPLYAQWEKIDTTVDISDGEFEFTLHSGEMATFDNIPAGTTYQVWEETPAGWILIDSSNVTGAIPSNDEARAEFTNEFSPERTQAVLQAQKNLDGKPASEGAFTFTLSKDGEEIESVTNDGTGLVSFKPIEYAAEDAGKTYTYTIREQAGGDSSIRYDSNVVTVTVAIDNVEGALVAKVTYPADELPVFTNDTLPGNLAVSKSVVGATSVSENATFDFTVTFTTASGAALANQTIGVTGIDVTSITTGADGSATFTLKAGQTATFNNVPAGTKYVVNEATPSDGWSLTDSQNTSGTIQAVQTAQASFTNTYEADGSITLKASKAFEGGTLNADEFTFKLLDAQGAEVETQKNGPVDMSGSADTNPDYGKSLARFSTLKFGLEDVGKTFEYTIVEVAGDDPTIEYDSHEEHVTITVSDGGNGSLVVEAVYDSADNSAGAAAFVNKVKPGSLSISKVLENASTAAAATPFVFTVTLTDADDQPLANAAFAVEGLKGTTEVTTDANGEATLKIRGGETATIVGLPHGTSYVVTEQVVNGFTNTGRTGDAGTIVAGEASECTFENLYAAEGLANLEAKKMLEGGELIADQFLFKAYDEDGTVVATGRNDANGMVKLTPIFYGIDDVDKTFTYTIREENDANPGITYDSHVEKVTVEVSDDGAGSILTKVTYDSTDATPGQALFQNEMGPGTLTVSKETVNMTEAASDAEFSFTVTFTKADGSALADKELTLVTSDGNKAITTDASGAVTFTLKSDQTAIIEGIPNATNYVVAENDLPGGWEKTDAVNVSGIVESGKVAVSVVTNEYKAIGNIAIPVKKVFDTNVWPAGQEFTFTLEAITEGAPVPADAAGLTAVATEAAPQAAFGSIAFTNDDIGKTYTYRITEVIPEDATEMSDGSYMYDKVTYSAEPQEVTVTIADNGDGTLDVVLSGNGLVEGVAEFENIYDEDFDFINLSGKKAWDDADDQDGIRPGSVTILLFANGEQIDSVVVTAAENWAWSFSHLPSSISGEEVDYTVDEVKTDVIAGTDGPGTYAIAVTGDAENGFTVTNKHTPETTEASIKKVWDDADDQDGIRPASLTVTLSNGEKAVLDESNGWSATITGLPKFAAGEEIAYSWSEPETAGYTLSGTAKDGALTTLTNKHTPETTEASIKKVWDDADDQDGIRPTSVTIHLIADGIDTGKTLTLSAENSWAGSFTDLPKFSAGEPIAYTMTEDPVKGYDAPTITGDAESGFTVTNPHTPEPPTPSDETPPSDIAKTGDDLPVAGIAGISLGSLATALIAYGIMRHRRREER